VVNYLKSHPATQEVIRGIVRDIVSSFQRGGRGGAREKTIQAAQHEN